MEQTPSEKKWEAKVTRTLKKAKAEEIWEFFADFFGHNKWLLTLPTCYGIHGTNGEPGCIRYCAGFSFPPEGHSNLISWSKERLLSIDHFQGCLVYEIVDTNVGFNNYVSTVRILPLCDDCGCVIEWSIELDPVKGFLLDNLVEKYGATLQLIAKTMEDDICASKQPFLSTGSSSLPYFFI